MQKDYQHKFPKKKASACSDSLKKSLDRMKAIIQKRVFKSKNGEGTFEEEDDVAAKNLKEGFSEGDEFVSNFAVLKVNRKSRRKERRKRWVE